MCGPPDSLQTRDFRVAILKKIMIQILVFVRLQTPRLIQLAPHLASRPYNTKGRSKHTSLEPTIGENFLYTKEQDVSLQFNETRNSCVEKQPERRYGL
jgi:hypothetical protein